MVNLVTHHLLFTAQVVTPLMLDEHSGSALRGNLFQAVWERFCTNKASPSCAECILHTTCPVSALVAPLREEHARGRDIPRPYIILPPLVQYPMTDRGNEENQTSPPASADVDDSNRTIPNRSSSHRACPDGFALGEMRRYGPGETLQFGITLFGSIVQLLPYLMLSINMLEAAGLGQRLSENHGQRGRFHIMLVENYNPVTAERRTLYEKGQQLFQVPTISVTEQDICKRAEQLPDDRVTLTFLTPTRIVQREHLLRRALFAPIMHRLLERLMALENAYGEGASMTMEELWALVEQAEQIECIEDCTRWSDVKSYSNRQRRFTPIGGLVGKATFAGNLAQFREYLLWGELIHIGKSCVKGDGWYRIDV
jgi:CRISPR-associated endoribonuclease Cas6